MRGAVPMRGAARRRGAVGRRRGTAARRRNDAVGPRRGAVVRRDAVRLCGCAARFPHNRVHRLVGPDPSGREPVGHVVTADPRSACGQNLHGTAQTGAASVYPVLISLWKGFWETRERRVTAACDGRVRRPRATAATAACDGRVRRPRRPRRSRRVRRPRATAATVCRRTICGPRTTARQQAGYNPVR